ncbi:hypothetical protein OBBRIDRAFT_438178 [Obba rivulosa]|uniref:Uncharacterized protein n=1 Tax=Obba rivulosa TaxID=1052685 RepID=A0A8E2ARY5_9APHY|nr:hypothetical protein OBBRIDRAFT_438178 [Obba rivulosa]
MNAQWHESSTSFRDKGRLQCGSWALHTWCDRGCIFRPCTTRTRAMSLKIRLVGIVGRKYVYKVERDDGCVPRAVPDRLRHVLGASISPQTRRGRGGPVRAGASRKTASSSLPNPRRNLLWILEHNAGCLGDLHRIKGLRARPKGLVMRTLKATVTRACFCRGVTQVVCSVFKRASGTKSAAPAV